MEIEWSHQAQNDLRKLIAWISEDSPYYARQFAERVFAAVERLADFPEMGRHVPEAEGRSDVRELLYRGYRIIYLIGDERLFIVTIVHGRRDLSDTPAKPWEIG